jgi:hypothetical protein
LDGRITLLFAPQAFVGFGGAVEGRSMLSDMVLTQPDDDDHDLKQQHVRMATGEGQSWLFVRYDYTRRH